MNTKTTEEKITKLRAEYISGLTQRFAEINQAYIAVIESRCSPEQIEQLEILSHTLCGSAGTFGFGNIYAYCKKIEEFSRLLLKEVTNINLMNEISKTISQLEDAILNPKITDQLPVLDFPPPPAVKQIDKLVYILNANKAVSAELKTKIERYGYDVEYFNRLDDFIDAIEK